MATHDYVLANQSGSSFRSDLNNALAAIVSQNSSATEPATKYAYQYWVDTSATPALIKQRNAANNNWVTLAEVGGQTLADDGTNAKPGISFADDVNTGLKRNAADDVSIVTGGTQAITIDSSQNVAIGTSGPSSQLHLKKSDATAYSATATDGQVGVGPTLYLENPANTNASVGGQIVFGMRSTEEQVRIAATGGTTPALTFGTADVERMRINSSGKVGIGTTSPEAKLNISSGDVGFTPNADADELFLEHTDNCGITIGCGPNKTGNIYFGEQGVGTSRGAIVYKTNGNSMAFSTAGLTNERMKINGNGYVTLADQAASNAMLSIPVLSSGIGAITSEAGTSGNRLHMRFKNTNGLVGSIVTGGSGTAYNTSSDYRLKENVVDIADGITRVKQLAPKRFNFIVDADTTVDGFLAHEAQTVVPEAVTGTQDETENIGTLTEWDGTVLETDVVEPAADELTWEETITDEDGNETVETRTRTWTQTGSQPVYQGIDQAKLVPLLTAALQEAIAKIETLETKVAALEAAN
tara:strand:- start:1428 stop:3008 length:1581 start_codon:yes stop_codon:yes gene_type:complete